MLGICDMEATSLTVPATPLLRYVLQRADDALILGHRLSEWCGAAPTMEEEMALANMGLDLIGQARALYGYAATLEGNGRTEDDFAYFRDERGFGNLLLLEQPNGDFAQTMVRQYLYAAFIDLYWQALMQSPDATLAAIAAKAEKESAYHLRHSAEWVIRLGDGTAESHKRAQQALERLWPYTGEMFMQEAEDMRGIVPDPVALRPAWLATVKPVFERATLRLPQDGWMQKGGREGLHSEHLGHLLAEMQSLARVHPKAVW